ncbi:MAG TPA: hypothetical protein PLV61_12420 [Parvularculaceae bacterium]|nr:hypothetical protein [Parvularculaceae bacterium]
MQGTDLQNAADLTFDAHDSNECCAPVRSLIGEQDHVIDVRTVLLALGRRRMVGGQEDMIVDGALDLKK